MIVETKNFDLVDSRRENYLPNPGGLWAKVPTQGFLGGPALGRDRLWQASERSGCLWQPEDVASPGSKDLAAPSNEASLWPSAGAQAGWGLEKPLPALVADMAEGERAPSHELRGSWALTQGGRPGDPGQRDFRDIGNQTWLRRLHAAKSAAGFPRKGKLCSPSTAPPSARMVWLACQASFSRAKKAEQRCTALSGAAFTELVSGVAVDWQSGAYRAASRRPE